jgi:hypothetical protein
MDGGLHHKDDQTTLLELFLNYKMTSYIDEALFDAAGLTDFPELYAYIREREPKPITDPEGKQITTGP